MATTSQRRLEPTSVRHFGTGLGDFELPDLTALQTVSYAAFLQADVDARRRKDQGLESVLREIFPISSYDGNTTLEFLHFEPVTRVSMCAYTDKLRPTCLGSS